MPVPDNLFFISHGGGPWPWMPEVLQQPMQNWHNHFLAYSKRCLKDHRQF